MFVDIEPSTGNIDLNKVEIVFMPKPTAIMPVHVDGKLCNSKIINDVTDKHSLRVIYNATHVLDVEVNGESILNADALSTLSFHANKGI